MVGGSVVGGFKKAGSIQIYFWNFVLLPLLFPSRRART